MFAVQSLPWLRTVCQIAIRFLKAVNYFHSLMYFAKISPAFWPPYLFQRTVLLTITFVVSPKVSCFLTTIHVHTVHTLQSYIEQRHYYIIFAKKNERCPKYPLFHGQLQCCSIECLRFPFYQNTSHGQNTTRFLTTTQTHVCRVECCPHSSTCPRCRWW